MNSVMYAMEYLNYAQKKVLESYNYLLGTSEELKEKLIEAIKNDDKNKIKSLLEEGARLDSDTLENAALYNNKDLYEKHKEKKVKWTEGIGMVLILMKAKGYEDTSIYKDMIKENTYLALSSLINETASNNLETTKKLLTFEEKDSTRQFYKAKLNYEYRSYKPEKIDEMVKELVKKNFREKDDKDTKEYINDMIQKIYEQYQKNINSLDCYKLLSSAIEANNLVVIRMFLENKIDPDWRPDNKPSLLGLALKNRSFDTTNLLLSYNANPNQPIAQDQYPLLYAIGKKLDIKFLKLLIKYGANINVKSKDGITPLILAILQNNQEAFILLICQGALFNNTQYAGKSSLYIALESGIKSKDYTMFLILLYLTQKGKNEIIQEYALVESYIKYGLGDIIESNKIPDPIKLFLTKKITFSKMLEIMLPSTKDFEKIKQLLDKAWKEWTENSTNIKKYKFSEFEAGSDVNIITQKKGTF